MKKIPDERMSPIYGFERRYSITSTGYVISKMKGGLPLSPGIKPGGYLFVGLHPGKGGKASYRMVHRLVAEAFIPNPENKPEVNHKDGNKLNNCVSNLEWVTRSENAQHGHDNGLMPQGEKHPFAKLTPEQVLEIFQSKGSCRAVGAMYGVNAQTVSNIRNRKTYKKVLCEVPNEKK